MKTGFTTALLAAMCGFCAPASAQAPDQRALEVEVAPNQTQPGVKVEVSLRSGQAPGLGVGPENAGVLALKEGDLALVCVTASEAGYLSIWSRTRSELRRVRIYPNDHTPEARLQKGGFLNKGEERCYGGGADGYRFRVRPPYEQAEIYVHWSETLEGQFEPEDLPSFIGEPSLSAGGKSLLPRPYASARLRYQVVP